MKAQSDINRTLDAIDAHFPIALGSVCVPCGEQCTRIEHGQVERGTVAKFANIHIAAEDSWRACTEFSVPGRGNAHHSTDWPGERMDAASIDLEEFGRGHSGANLSTTGINTLKMNRIAGIDADSRR